MQFGISTASFYPMPLINALQAVGQTGASVAEVFFNTFRELEPSFVRTLRQIADDTGMEVRAVHPFSSGFEPFLFFTDYEARFQDALELYRHYFEAANLIGASILVFHGDRAESPMPEEACFERFARLQQLATEYGILLAQENVSRCKSREMGYLVRQREYLGGNMPVVFDNKQALRSGVSAEDFLRRFGENLVHVHISDHDANRDCLPLGEGEVSVDGLLGLLAQTGYQGGVVVELYRQLLERDEQVVQSFRVLSAAGAKYR